MTGMTPSEARDALVELHHRPFGELFDLAERALATLAAMRVEHDHGVVDWEQVDGRYETRHRVRLVSDWRDADALAAAGVLADDLPEPTRVGPDFTHWGPVALERDTGAIAIGVSGPYTQDPDEARAWAKYLAAAAHAQKEETNE